jgi:hypothetical protein
VYLLLFAVKPRGQQKKEASHAHAQSDPHFHFLMHTLAVEDGNVIQRRPVTLHKGLHPHPASIPSVLSTSAARCCSCICYLVSDGFMSVTHLKLVHDRRNPSVGLPTVSTVRVPLTFSSLPTMCTSW